MLTLSRSRASLRLLSVRASCSWVARLERSKACGPRAGEGLDGRAGAVDPALDLVELLVGAGVGGQGGLDPAEGGDAAAERLAGRAEGLEVGADPADRLGPALEARQRGGEAVDVALERRRPSCSAELAAQVALDAAPAGSTDLGAVGRRPRVPNRRQDVLDDPAIDPGQQVLGAADRPASAPASAPRSGTGPAACCRRRSAGPRSRSSGCS